MNYEGKCPDLAFRLQKLLEARLGGGTAISFALVQEGEVVAAACAGTKDGDPTHPADLGDLYGIGSLSKIYCTMAVLKLCEMGKANLDTPVCEYLPEFVMKDERYRKITLRMCLNHSSGLPGTMFRNFYMNSFADPAVFYHDFFEYLSESELKANPGVSSVYCNDGFELAEIVVARLSGMSFTSFIQKYIAGPLGLPSTCSPEGAPAGHDYIRMQGCPMECLSYIGAGGMYSDMRDCAKFGWAFVEPGVAFTAESAAETMKPQKLVYSEEDHGADFGLGWDSVCFSVPGADLGGVLLKTGGSYGFSSYLAVSSMYRMSLAISATVDSESNTMGVLLEIVGQLMSPPEAAGSEAGDEATYFAPAAVPLPEGYAEKFSGVYYSDSERIRATFRDDALTLSNLTRTGWEETEKDLPFNGLSFGVPGADYMFTINGDIAYLNNRVSAKFAAIAEKCADKAAVNNVWTARNGRKYIVANADIHDLGAGAVSAAAEIVSDEQSSVVSVVTGGYLTPYSIMPALASGDDTTRMFLTAPTIGSRNIYPFSIRKVDGVEYLSWCGYLFVDAESLPNLTRGRLILEAGKCAPYRITDPVTFAQFPPFARAILLDEALSVTFDSAVNGTASEACAGYAILMSAEKGEVQIC